HEVFLLQLLGDGFRLVAKQARIKHEASPWPAARTRPWCPAEGNCSDRDNHEPGFQRLRVLLASRSRSSFRRSAIRVSNPLSSGS
ncbi:MAG: hypothetical protein P8Y95_05945, partial [Gammaproteobacteria bacterium]